MSDSLTREIARTIARFEHESGPPTSIDEDGAEWPRPQWDELDPLVQGSIVARAMPVAAAIVAQLPKSKTLSDGNALAVRWYERVIAAREACDRAIREIYAGGAAKWLPDDSRLVDLREAGDAMASRLSTESVVAPSPAGEPREPSEAAHDEAYDAFIHAGAGMEEAVKAAVRAAYRVDFGEGAHQ